MQLPKAVAKTLDFYAIKPGAPVLQREFGWFTLDKWAEQGYIKPRCEVSGSYNEYLNTVFGFDGQGWVNVGGLGWCEAELLPRYEEKVLEDRGEYELVQDWAGRKLLCFKGRRNGFMPEYTDHPVRDKKSWENEIKWRLDPDTPGRCELTAGRVAEAVNAQKIGYPIVQQCVGGYMYLRSLIGPENLLYAFYDMPEVIHDAMKSWLKLADSVTARHQKSLQFDELYLGEDICYNHGALISPDMMREFLLPYYSELYENMKARNGGRRLHFQIDTDGYCHNVIDVYRAIGVDSMSPFEVASGCDVVAIGAKYPDMLLSGGIDKRVLASDFESIDRHVFAVMEPLKKRGGYIPTCDHGVPEEVSFENYMHYRERMLQYAD